MVYSTGRGGAGNIRPGDKDVRDADPGHVPEIQQKVYTTGRGGAGNMRANKSKEITRQAQDMEMSDNSLMPVTSPTLGRGGYGNVRAGQKASLSFFKKAKHLFGKGGEGAPEA